MSSDLAELERPLAELPDGWSTQPLSKLCCELVERVDPAGMNGKLSGLYVGLEHMGQGTGQLDGVGNAAAVVSQKSRFHGGDILFGKLRPNLRKVARPDFGGVCSTDIIVLRAKATADPAFIFQLLQSDPLITHAVATAAGTKMPRTHARSLLSFKVAAPPLHEQRRIAEVLRSVDEAITAADAVIRGLQTAASEIAQRAFSDPDDVELDCDVTTFGDLFDIKGGNQPPKSSFVYQPKEGYVRLLQIRDFESDDKPAYISEESTSARCAEDDILIARYGASVGRILTGKAGAYNVALTKIVFRNDRIVRRYAYHWLRSEYFQSRIKAVSNRSAQAGFNKEDLFPTKIALPRLPAQAEVAEALDDIERAVSVNRHERDQLADLRTALRDDLLSGRVRVPA